MKRVACLIDQRELDVAEYSSQDAAWQWLRRRHLYCLGCKAPAQYKKGSKRRGPCFAARHFNACPLRGVSWTVFRYLQ